MPTIINSLRSVTNFPLPQAALDAIIARRGLDGGGDLTAEAAESRAYRLATADIYRWVSLAANISQGGQSYSLASEDKKRLIASANSIYRQYGEEDMAIKDTLVNYGYKGSRL